VKKAVAALLVLAGLAATGVLAARAVEQDHEYRRLIVAGDAALARGQAFVAIESYSGAIALKNDSMLAYLKRGEAHHRRGESPETLAAALRDLRMAAALDPSNTRTQEELGDVNYALRRFAAAVESYERYLQLDDRSAPIHYKLALAWRGAGRPVEAIAALQRAIALGPRFHEAHYLLGLCFRDREQLDDARVAFRRAIEIAPAFIPAREELAELFRLQERSREELDALDALAALDPKPERLVAVGLAYLRAGSRERAVTTLRLAAERYPEHASIYVALGQVWLNAAEDSADPSDVAKALEALAPIATQATASSEVLGLYGRALSLAGRHTEAEQIFKQAAAKLPADPEVLPQYASVAQLLGHLDDARQALVRYSALVDDDPDRVTHAVRIADLSMRLNDSTTAIAWYQKSQALGRNDASLLARLANAYARAGQLENARDTARRSIERDPDNPAAQAIAAQLQVR
jgi:tetratricopeptide (TPR) repeat protein